MKKRLLSILLVLALALAVLPQAALAAEPDCAHEHTAPVSESIANSRGTFFQLLWRMAGCPEPTIKNEYVDLSETDSYYKAALWAVENNISNGITATEFAPGQVLTRGQAVTFLWRYAGTPEPAATKNPYDDVKSTAFYYKAVLWAAETDWVELNAGNGQFRPDNAVGQFLLEGTACEDCGAVVETAKLTFDQAVVASGICGGNLKWKIADGTMTVTGSGEMYDYTEENLPPWYQYRETVSELVLPDGMTTVGDQAFYDFRYCQNITIPDSVVYIGVDAFRFCAYTSSVTLPEGLQYIDDGAFAGIDEMTSITIPGSVIHVGNRAFASCDLLRHVTISEGVLSLGDNVFMNDLGLSDVHIPQSVMHVGYNPFDATGAYRTSANWENGVMYLDGWALGAKDSITEARIRAGTRGVADFALCLDEHPNLQTVTLPDSLEFVGDMAFAATDLTGDKLPKNLRYIGEGAFSSTCLTAARLPAGVEYLGAGAFYGCTYLKSAVIPEGLKEIGAWSFAYCPGLKSIEIPASVEYVGEAAFYDTGLTSVTIAGRACEIEEGEEAPAYMLGDPETTTVYGYAGSPAEAYAKQYGYRFTPLSEQVPFVDVPAKAFYSDPVAWALENEITNGVDDAHFGPDRACTRGQVVTFLWRAAGCPEPANAKTSFTDVKSGAYYEKAVAWAVEQGITNGTSANTFSPDAACNRGQIVTFLWRFKGEAEPAGVKTPFTDLKPGAFYEKAVAWAVENKITNGLTASTFVPDGPCTRGQVVTFLQRAAGADEAPVPVE